MASQERAAGTAEMTAAAGYNSSGLFAIATCKKYYEIKNLAVALKRIKNLR